MTRARAVLAAALIVAGGALLALALRLGREPVRPAPVVPRRTTWERETARA